MSDFDILGVAASGMEAQRAAMDVDARNVALAQVGDARHPAHGLEPQFATMVGVASADGQDFDGIEARLDRSPFDAADDSRGADGDGVVAFTGVKQSTMPVDSIGEMINVLDAQRAYEADASVFDMGKRLFERTIDMGRV